MKISMTAEKVKQAAAQEEDRADAPEGEQHAAGHRTQQAGEGVDLVDDGIPGDELFFLHQQGDAGLDGPGW